jgi:carboxymethylenebutenolidase
MLEIGQRLASHDYFVLLPDLFYRSGPYAPMNAKTVFRIPEERKVLMEKFFAPATLPNLMSDTRAFLDYLESQPEVRPGGIGTTGYCMGGAASLAAASFPEEMKSRLDQALSQAGVDYELETYSARHGFVIRDTANYDAAAGERHWSTLLALFDQVLKA